MTLEYLAQFFNIISVDNEVVLGIVMIAILFIGAFILFSHFTGKVLKKNVLVSKEKYRIMFKGLKQIMAMTNDSIFAIDLRDGLVIYSENMQARFGWHFPDKISKSDREDVSHIWQIAETDVDILRRMFTDVSQDGKNVSESIRLLNANRHYIGYEVELRPVLDKKNKVVCVVGNIKHD